MAIFLLNYSLVVPFRKLCLLLFKASCFCMRDRGDQIIIKTFRATQKWDRDFWGAQKNIFFKFICKNISGAHHTKIN